MSRGCDGNAGALGDSLLALTSQRVPMELLIHPLLRSSLPVHTCARIFCCGASGGAERWELYKTDCGHKSCQLKTSCHFRIFFLFLPFPSTFDAFILFSNLISINNGRWWGQQDPGGLSAAASDDSCRYLSSNRS